VAVSHNSYAQAVAARSLGIPVMTAMDYEHQPANHLAFRCADLVAVPETYPIDALCRQGARPERTWRYRGLKEEVTLAGFAADPGYLESLGIDDSKVIVVVRPPADMALYHRFQNTLFGTLLQRLIEEDAVTTLMLPRTPEQSRQLEERGFGALMWHGDVLDGRQLAAGADLVISAGGSMIREAAVLGTPACSLFAGRLGGVDRALVAGGRLQLLATEADIAAPRFVKKEPREHTVVGDRLLSEFIDRLLALRDGRRSPSDHRPVGAHSS
jgi:hypothetical protein